MDKDKHLLIKPCLTGFMADPDHLALFLNAVHTNRWDHLVITLDNFWTYLRQTKNGVKSAFSY